MKIKIINFIFFILTGFSVIFTGCATIEYIWPYWQPSELSYEIKQTVVLKNISKEGQEW